MDTHITKTSGTTTVHSRAREESGEKPTQAVETHFKSLLHKNADTGKNLDDAQREQAVPSRLLSDSIAPDESTSSPHVSSDENQDKNPGGIEKNERQTPGELILRQLEKPAPVQKAPPSCSGEIQELATQLADRVFVSQPRAGENREVRIFLREDLLSGTEVRIGIRDGKVQVACLCSDIATERLLTQHVDTLKTALEQRFAGEAVVTVQGTEKNESGYSDGRSRQQRNLYEELPYSEKV